MTSARGFRNPTFLADDFALINAVRLAFSFMRIAGAFIPQLDRLLSSLFWERAGFVFPLANSRCARHRGGESFVRHRAGVILPPCIHAMIPSTTRR